MTSATSQPLSAAPRKASRKPANASFQTLLQKYATAATAATFAVVGVSGVLLFFHVGEAQLMGVHEWLGMAFVGAAVFHVTRHFRGFSTLMTKTRTRALFAATAMIASAFILPTAFQTDSGNPMKQFVGAASNAPISAVAEVAGKTPDQVVAQFAQAGMIDVASEQTLSQVAKANGQDVRALWRIVMSDVTKG